MAIIDGRMIYSFDIFDTCFVRACGNAKNIFDILAHKVLGDHDNESKVIDFILARINAEKEARKRGVDEEVSLDEIYKNFNLNNFTHLSKEEVAKYEMDIEKQQIVAVYDIKEKIRNLRNESNQIYYISDMYLPYEWFIDILKENDFWDENDKLYVSSEIRLTKKSGNIFKYISQTNNIKYCNWTHYGDNKHSDFRMPRKLGIKSILVHYNYTYYEKFVLSQNFHNNFNVTERLSSISKACRLHNENDPDDNFFIDLIAPIFIPFVCKILKDANNKGITEIAFLSRDGYILYQIGLQINYLFPHIHLHYIEVSRSSLYIPGLKNFSIDNFIKLKNHFRENISFLYFLKQLLPSSICDELLNPSLLSEFSGTFEDNCILFYEKFKNNIDNYRTQQKKYFIEYLIQKGFLSRNKRLAIVDLRGSRTCQESINNILTEFGYNRAFAYYFEVVANRNISFDCGSYSSEIYDEKLYGNNKNILSIANVLEEYFSLSPFNRTLYYKGENQQIMPIYEDKDIDDNIINIVNARNKIIRRYCKLYTLNNLQLYDIISNISIPLLGHFSSLPQYEYITPLSKIDQRNKPLVSNLLYNLKSNNYCWLRGSIAYTFRSSTIINIISWGEDYFRKVKQLISKIL